MDLFAYILILTSVIFALAVAQILEGVSRIAQSPTPVRAFLPHTIWVLNLFLYIFLIWWATWEFRSVEWSFPRFAYMLIAPTLLFFACSLLTPQKLDGDEVSLEAHFFRVHRPFFAAYFFAALAVIVDGSVLGDEPLWFPGRIGHLTILGAAIVGFFSGNRKTHVALAAVTLLAYVILGTTRFLLPR